VRAWIAHEHPPKERPRAYGLLRVAGNAAWAVGPAIGGLLAGRSYAAMFAATSVACFLCLGLLLTVVPDSPAARGGERLDAAAVLSGLRDARFAEFCALTLVLAASMAQLVAPMSAHASSHGGLSEASIGLLFGINGGLVVLLQTRASRLVSGTRLTRALAAGCLFYAAGWALIGHARAWGAFAFGMAVVTVGEVVVSPAMNALAANLAPERLRGRYMGLFGLSYQLGHAAGPALGGWGHDHFTGRWTAAPWLAAGALAGVAGWGYRRLGRRLDPAHEGAVNEEAA
jgi:predicted MFS family arabinose efflux permease